jgi:hypothetical protein
MLNFDEIPEAQSRILTEHATSKLSVMRCQTERSGVLISS